MELDGWYFAFLVGIAVPVFLLGIILAIGQRSWLPAAYGLFFSATALHLLQTPEKQAAQWPTMAAVFFLIVLWSAIIRQWERRRLLLLAFPFTMLFGLLHGLQMSGVVQLDGSYSNVYIAGLALEAVVFFTVVLVKPNVLKVGGPQDSPKGRRSNRMGRKHKRALSLKPLLQGRGFSLGSVLEKEIRTPKAEASKLNRTTDILDNNGVHPTRTTGARPQQVERIPADQIPRTIEAIRTLFNEEQIYCDEDLKSERLAEMVGVRSDQLSYILNAQMGISFDAMVNAHRIRAACSMMQREPGRKIDSIAQAVGFNSRSNFFKVFKERTGVTPAAWRRRSNRSR